MRASRFTVAVPVPGTGETFLFNSLTENQIVVSTDVVELLERVGRGEAPPADVTSRDAVGQLTELPQTPPFVRGVMNLRGAVVPVIDLGGRFGGPAAQISRRTCIIVVEVNPEREVSSDDEQGGSHVVGMLVDAVYEVFEASAADLEPVPAMGTRVAPEHLRAMARVRGEACAVLDLNHLLAQATLAELIASHPTIATRS